MSAAAIIFFKVGFSLRKNIAKMNTKIGVMFTKVMVTPTAPWDNAKQVKSH